MSKNNRSVNTGRQGNGQKQAYNSNYAHYTANSADKPNDRYNRSESFKFAINTVIVGKTSPQKLSYVGAFRPASGNFYALSLHIGKGHPWMPAILDDGKTRKQEYANHAEILALDIDNTDILKDDNGKGIKVYHHQMTIEEALEHPFVKAHCGLVIESASSQPEWNKFRLVFRLPQALISWQQIKLVNTFLMSQLGDKVADPSCKDASRYFFGAPDREPILLNESAVLPADFLEQAVAWEKAQAEAERAAIAAKRSAYKGFGDRNDSDIEIVRQALKFIPERVPGSGNYSVCLDVLMALNHAFGAEIAIELAEEWSPSFGDWDIPKKIKGFKSEGVVKPKTLGSLFHHAKSYGFDRQAAEAARAEANKDKLKAAVADAEAKLVKIYAQLLEAQAITPNLKAAYEQAKDAYDRIPSKKAFAERKAAAKVARDTAKAAWIKGKEDVDLLRQRVAWQQTELKEAHSDVDKAAKAVRSGKINKWQRWANSLDFEPTTITNEQFEKGVLPDQPGLILVDARMGQGKTSQQIDGFRQCQAKRFPNGKVCIPGSRNGLVRSNVFDLKGVFHEAFKEDLNKLNNQVWLAMAFDSLWKVDVDKITAGSLLIIDEITAGFLHLLLSGTLKRDGKRMIAIKRFEAIVKKVYEMGGWVIASVDGLANPEINYLLKLMGKEVSITFNKSTAKPIPVDITVLAESSMILERIVQYFAQHPNEPIVFMADSQKELRIIVRHLVERGILREDQIAVFDSKTSAEKWAREAIDVEGLQAFILRTKPLLFAFTPTLENGVSIKTAIEGSITEENEWGISYFKHRFGYFAGVLSARSLKQMLFRIRHAVPTTVWIADKGSPHPLSSGLLPEDVMNDLKRTAADVADYTYLQGLSEGLKTGKKESYQEGVKDALAAIGEQANIELFAAVMSHKKFDEVEALAPAYQLLCELVARENYDKLNLKANLIALYKEAGHRVIEDESEPCKEFKRERKELAAQIVQIDANEFAFTDDTVLSDGTPLDPDTARQIRDDHKANHADALAARKCLLRESLPIPPELDQMEFVNEEGETETLRLLDCPKFVKEWVTDGDGDRLKDLKMFWAVMHPELQQQTDTASVNNLFKNAVKKADPELRSVFAADVKVDGVKAKFLSDSPFPEAYREIAVGGCYTSKAEVLEPLKAWAVENAARVKRDWGIDCKESQSPSTIFNRFCRGLGVTVENTLVKVNKNLVTNSAFGLLNTLMPNLLPKQWTPGATVRVYRLANLDAPDRVALLAAFDAKAARNSEVSHWINSLPLPAQIDLYKSISEGRADAALETYEAYLRDRGIKEPMNAVQRMWVKKTLIDQTSRYFAESGTLEATEFNILVSDLERMSQEIYETIPSEDIEIPF